MILAIDTSTEQASIALADDALLAECSWTANRNHSRQLTTAIRHLMELEGVTVGQLSSLVVAKGPGSFSGVRVGISEAKGIAMALHIPLVGIPTLDVIGFQASAPHRPVWAVLPAGRKDVYLAHYVGDSDEWKRVGDYRILPIPQAAAAIGPLELVAGAGAELLRPHLVHSESMIQPAALRLRRAGYLAELGRRYLDAGGHDQLDELEPLYLRRPAAEEKRAAPCQE